MNVLVVDDQPSLRLLLATFLEGAGYTVSGAAHGRDALTYLHQSHELPGLILLDVAMPVMSGWEFLSAQQRNRRIAAIPVVIMTALADMTHDGMFPTVVAYLYKPLDLSRLIEVVAAYYRTPLQAKAVGA
jgi:two-component system, chemotaxis family, chemotaxis protein CheY